MITDWATAFQKIANLIVHWLGFTIVALELIKINII